MSDTIMELERAIEIVGWMQERANDPRATREERADAASNKWADTIKALEELIVRHGGHTHDCMANAQPCTTDGPLGHGWECGRCGNFLQAG